MITVKFFASFRDIAGTETLDINVDETVTITDLIKQLEYRYPRFEGKLGTLALVAVNEKYAHHQQELQHGDVVAFFPPVSGG